jgi:hypothetical protein
MLFKELKPRKALNKAFLKVKPNRTDIEGFKTNLITLLDRTNDTESEEFHKNLVSDFLKDTYYKQNHFINTKGRNDRHYFADYKLRAKKNDKAEKKWFIENRWTLAVNALKEKFSYPEWYYIEVANDNRNIKNQ